MRTLVIITLIIWSNIIYCQVFNRIECDVSIKEIGTDKSQQLMVGKVYFDKFIREIVYQITFPYTYSFGVKKEGFVTNDTLKAIEPGFSSQLIDFSVFNLFLNGQLDYFGLKESPYQLSNVSKEDDMVISEWELPEEMGNEYGKMIISQKNKKLFGLVSLNAKGEVISKQFFTHYIKVEGIDFPTQLTAFSYSNGAESKKITTFRNITLNNWDNDANYRFNVN